MAVPDFFIPDLIRRFQANQPQVAPNENHNRHAVVRNSGLFFNVTFSKFMAIQAAAVIFIAIFAYWVRNCQAEYPLVLLFNYLRGTKATSFTCPTLGQDLAEHFPNTSGVVVSTQMLLDLVTIASVICSYEGFNLTLIPRTLNQPPCTARVTTGSQYNHIFPKSGIIKFKRFRNNTLSRFSVQAGTITVRDPDNSIITTEYSHNRIVKATVENLPFYNGTFTGSLNIPKSGISKEAFDNNLPPVAQGYVTDSRVFDLNATLTGKINFMRTSNTFFRGTITLPDGSRIENAQIRWSDIDANFRVLRVLLCHVKEYPYQGGLFKGILKLSSTMNTPFPFKGSLHNIRLFDHSPITFSGDVSSSPAHKRGWPEFIGIITTPYNKSYPFKIINALLYISDYPYRKGNFTGQVGFTGNGEIMPVNGNFTNATLTNDQSRFDGEIDPNGNINAQQISGRDIGSLFTFNKQINTTEIHYTNGNIQTNYNGTTSTFDKDTGIVRIYYPNNTEVTIEEEPGFTTTKYPNGTMVRNRGRNGAVDILHPNGTMTTKWPDGRQITYFPKATKATATFNNI